MKLAVDTRGSGGERGFAVILVILVLAALFILCAPFLMSARNASKSSTALADRAQGRLLLDSGARHARALLARSHPATDTTPYFDSEEELAVDSAFDTSFWNTRDPHGPMWDVEAEDVAGRIDWNSAPPEVVANALGSVTRLTAKLTATAKEIVVSSTAGFEPIGFVWVGGELVGYGAIEGVVFKKLVRGLAASDAPGGSSSKDAAARGCGPDPPSDHEPGTLVIDQRAFAPALWRMAGGTGELRRLEALEQLGETASASLAGKFSGETLATLARLGTTYGGVRAGREWQRAARLVTPIQSGITCEVQVDESRWFNPGTTVRISDGVTTELALVQEVKNDGTLRFMQALGGEYAAFSAELRPLARRPINVNTASARVLECVFANLQLRGVNDRITPSEARALAALVIASRPFTGEEDFLRRVVLPACGAEKLPADAPVVPEGLASGETPLSVDDAIALYRNAHNANDSDLAFSTLPLAYVSRDVYALETRAAVNAESGIERARMVREQVSLFAPQAELMRVWSRQEDFDQALRLDREAPWWSSGPQPTSRWDGGASPPSRIRSHWGTLGGGLYQPALAQSMTGQAGGGIAQHVFASREDDGFAQLWATRVDETGVRAGRVEHFDDETRDLEGRYLPDQVFEEATNSKRLLWSDTATGFARSLSLSMWLEPRTLGDGLFLDVGNTAVENDRITLGVEGEDLVLRVYDGPGDHPETPEQEYGEIRFATAAGDGPGLLGDTWSHVSIDVRGTRPDQMLMLVDGRDFGVRTLGLTRLTAPLSQTSAMIQIDSGEGFPDQGVVRIGEELVEYQKQGSTTLVATRSLLGKQAGFGGRLAREPFDLAGEEPGINGALAKNVAHASGTSVMLYGYSIPLLSNVPSASSALQTDIGPFAVGVVQAVVGASTSLGDAIILEYDGFTLGQGLEGPSSATGLVLRSPDPALTIQQMMSAFSANGGYAAICQRSLDGWTGPQGTTSNWKTAQGTELFGMEIVRYSGRDTSSGTLFLAHRDAIKPAGKTGGARAYVADWGNVTINGVDPDTQLIWEIFVVPISLPAPGAGGANGFLLPSGGSEFAQITHVDQAELTEWIRYDLVLQNDLVRNDADSMEALSLALTHGNGGDADGQTGGGGPGPSSNASFAPPAPPAPTAAQQNGGSNWEPYLGEREDAGWPVSRAAREALQFRGVLGTFSHAHPPGTPILPVFRVQLADASGGRPGRLDPAFLVDASPTDPGWPVRVHFAHIPFEYSVTHWQGDQLIPTSAPQAGAIQQSGFVLPAIYVALQTPSPVPMAAGTSGPNVPAHESRLLARLTMHPSGERPREIARAVIGAGLRGGQTPSASIDELVFGSTTFGEGTSQGAALQGANLIVLEAFSESDTSTAFAPHSLRSARGTWGDPTLNALGTLPEDSGLLRIGTEILAYDGIDPATGSVSLAAGGRGLLGTEPQAHEVGETAMFLDQFTVSQLASDIGAGDSTLPLESTDGFPFAGTVIVGDELAHYTRLAGNSLDMPSGSKAPGKMDGLGGGLFRGRYGSGSAGHLATDPVILFPFRYWDRWADRADGPELSYYSFSEDQLGAFWRGVFWNWEPAGSPGSEIAVLQRTDPKVAWDADPEATPGLALLRDGMPENKPNAIGVQSDRAEWRVFARYTPGAWDAAAGLAHGWKQTPRLRLFGTTSLAPNYVLRQVDP